MSMVSISKAAWAAPKRSVGFISTNAAVNPHIQIGTIEKFRKSFWDAAYARSLKLGVPKSREVENPNSSSKHPSEEKYRSREEDEVAMLRKRARENMFKHFHMSAASRAMKRGDGGMSKYYYINKDIQSNHPHEDSTALQIKLPSRIDVSTATQAREEMNRHFWSSYQSRRDAQDGIKVRHPTTTHGLHNFAFTQNLHEHQFKLPNTLHDAYLEFGSHTNKMNGQPRPMVIMETKPPFQIVDVNKAWIQLYGYTHEKAIGSTVNELLQGPDTNADVVKNLSLAHLHRAKVNTEHEEVLVNYTPDGRKCKTQ
jgi:hypothetical protein